MDVLVLGLRRLVAVALARERAVELLRVGQWFKRLPSDFPIPFEVWEVFVMPHMVTRDYRPPPPPVPAPPRRSARVAGRG